jgi:hypothetical protein
MLFGLHVYRGGGPRGRGCAGGRATRGRRGAVAADAGLSRGRARGDIAAQEGLDGRDVFDDGRLDARCGGRVAAHRAAGLRGGGRGGRGRDGESGGEGRVGGPVARQLRLEGVLGISFDGHPPRLVQLLGQGGSAWAEAWHGLAGAGGGCWAGMAVLTCGVDVRGGGQGLREKSSVCRASSRYNGGGAEGSRVKGRAIAKQGQLRRGPLRRACAGEERDGRHREPWLLVDPCGYIRPLECWQPVAS